jgi:hypothetical protein
VGTGSLWPVKFMYRAHMNRFLFFNFVVLKVGKKIPEFLALLKKTKEKFHTFSNILLITLQKYTQNT